MKKWFGLIIGVAVFAFSVTACNTTPEDTTTTTAGSTAPTLTVNTPYDWFTNASDTVAVSGTATAPLGWGAYGVTLIIDNLGGGTYSNVGIIGQDTFSKDVTLPNGDYIFKLQAIDKDYNFSTEVARNVNVNTGLNDTNVPSVTITNPVASATINGAFTAAGTASDDISVQAVFVGFDGGAYEAATLTSGTSWTYLYQNYTNDLTPGSHTMYVYAEDTAGKVSTTNNVDFTYIAATGSFEFWQNNLPDGWNNSAIYTYGIGFTTVAAEVSDVAEGARALKLTWAADGSTVSAFWSQRDGVSEGEPMYFRIKAKGDGTAQARISISWYDSSSNYIIGSGHIQDYTAVPAAWTEYEGVLVAPTGTAFACPTIYGSSYATSDGTILFDDYDFGPVSDYDSASPTLDSLTDPLEGGTWGNDTIIFTGTASDDFQLYRIGAACNGYTNYAYSTPESFTGSLDVSLISAGAYSMYVWAEDYLGNKSSAWMRNINLTNIVRPCWAFANSSMEADAHITSGVTYQLTPAYSTNEYQQGARSLHITGIAGGNGNVFVSAVKMNNPLTNQRLIFYIKGTANVKSLCVYIGPTAGGASSGDAYNLGSVLNADIVRQRTGSASYTGAITNTNWFKVTLYLTNSACLFKTNNMTNAYFNIRGGTSGAYDIYIDNIHYER